MCNIFHFYIGRTHIHLIISCNYYIPPFYCIQSTEVESLHSEMEKERLKHDKDLMKKDSEREIVSEELDALTEQYQQLESVFESQSSQLSHSNSEIKTLRLELEAKRAELDRLSQQNKERRASLSRVGLLYVLSLVVSFCNQKTEQNELHFVHFWSVCMECLY